MRLVTVSGPAFELVKSMIGGQMQGVCIKSVEKRLNEAYPGTDFVPVNGDASFVRFNGLGPQVFVIENGRIAKFIDRPDLTRVPTREVSRGFGELTPALA